MASNARFALPAAVAIESSERMVDAHQSMNTFSTPFDELMCRFSPSHALDNPFRAPSRLSVLVLACSSAMFVPVICSFMFFASPAASANALACAANILPAISWYSVSDRFAFPKFSKAWVSPTIDGLNSLLAFFSKFMMMERRAVPAVLASYPAFANCSRLATSSSYDVPTALAVVPDLVMASPSHAMSPAPFCDAAASTFTNRAALAESPPIWFTDTDNVCAAVASSMPAASLRVMAFLVTSFNASDDSNSWGCCEPISRKASATCEAVRVEVEPSSMAYSFSVSRSWPVLPVNDDSIDIDFSKFNAVRILSPANLNAKPAPATAAPAAVNICELMPKRPAMPSIIPPRFPPLRVVLFSSPWNWSSSLLAARTRCFSSSSDLAIALPKGDCFSASVSRLY